MPVHHRHRHGRAAVEGRVRHQRHRGGTRVVRRTARCRHGSRHPYVLGEFARGQAIGIIYMLNSIQRRASWSNRFFQEQLIAFSKASKELQAMAGAAGAPSGAGSGTEPSAVRASWCSRASRSVVSRIRPPAATTPQLSASAVPVVP